MKPTIDHILKNDLCFLSLDLELNQPSGRIIQVGVALGKRLQSEEEYTVKQWLLSPQEPLAPFITELTGITEQDIAERAVPWEQMAQELLALIETHKPFVNPVTWGGGDSVELLQALRERDIAFPAFGRRWIDCKTYHVFSALAQGKSTSGGLRSIMSRYGMTFQGTPHRADVDALNTLRLFFKLLSRQANMEAVVSLSKNC